MKSAPLTVYAETSADSDVVRTLAPGESVQITFSVTNSGGAWCKVASVDSAEKLGYVRCDGLDRQSASNTAAGGPGAEVSTPVYQSSNNGTPSRAQQRWAIAASAILATFDREPLDTLSSNDSALGVRNMLQNWWDIGNRDEFLQALQWIDEGGHRQLFSTLGARTANLSPDELSSAVQHLNAEDANSVTMAHRYYEKYGAQSLTGWDYARYINLCRWGVSSGYISEEEAWPRVMHAAQILQQTFSSWREFGENYLVGRDFWSLSQTRIDGQQMRAIYQKLLNDPGSPWNRIPWSLPLEQPSSTARNSPDVPRDAQSGSASAASGPCDALQQAAASGQVSDAESILETQPGLVKCRDSRGWTPLYYAAFNGQTGTLQALVAHGAAVDTPDQDGTTPLYSAAFKGDTDVVRFLLEHGANIEARDHDGYSPLNTAAWAGKTDVVALLLAHNANVNTRAKDGSTPLHGAAADGWVEVATLLLEHGAKVNAGNVHGFTPLHSAADHDRTEVAEVLLAHGAEINARTDAGDTPLHWAANDNRMDAARFLLAHGAELDPKDKDDNTPLHWAAARGHVEMTELLIAHGADLKARTRLGCTPLRGAYDAHQAATAQVLLQHGATP
ncbi:MAG: ankyrin repeat domain-containing protein [Terracidiphilus sp.]